MDKKEPARIHPDSLRKLNRKLSKIHQDLTQIRHRRQPNQKSRQITYIPPHIRALPRPSTTARRTIELTVRFPFNLTFQIMDNVSIKWDLVDQSFLLRNPKRCAINRSDMATRRTMTPSTTDQNNFIYIVPGIVVLHAESVNYHFTPAPEFCGILQAGRVMVGHGVRVHLTHQGVTKRAIFPNGVTLGRLYIRPRLHWRDLQ